MDFVAQRMSSYNNAEEVPIMSKRKNMVQNLREKLPGFILKEEE